jgi:hypothetical protein
LKEEERLDLELPLRPSAYSAVKRFAVIYG